jgi:hypothetical protein
VLTPQEIRELCVRVSLSESPEQFKAALTDLKIALRDSITKMENRGMQMILDMPKRHAMADSTDSQV